MRRCYLVCYDVRNPKRLRRVHKLMKTYGEPWEYSVFYCTLKVIDRVLARHYGFTDEELDFIVNFDIKYRMGESDDDAEE